MQENETLTEEQAAEFLGVAPGTLRNARCKSWRGKISSPRFFRIGKLIRYAKIDLVEWLQNQREKQTAKEGANNG